MPFMGLTTYLGKKIKAILTTITIYNYHMKDNNVLCTNIYPLGH